MTRVGALCTLAHSILITILQERRYYDSHLIVKKSNTELLSDSPKVTQLVRGYLRGYHLFKPSDSGANQDKSDVSYWPLDSHVVLGKSLNFFEHVVFYM